MLRWLLVLCLVLGVTLGCGSAVYAQGGGDPPPEEPEDPPPTNYFDYLIDFAITPISWALKGLRWLLKTIICWMLELMFALAEPFWYFLVDKLPSGLLSVAVLSVHYFKSADAWLPLTEGLVIYGLWWLFLMWFVVVKFILKLVPFIG